MKIKEIREKTDEEITSEIKNLKEELFRLRFRKVTDEIENPSVLRKIKKDVARLKTVQRERKIKKASSPKEETSK